MMDKKNNKQSNSIILPLGISLFGFAVFSFCLRQSLSGQELETILSSQVNGSLTQMSLAFSFKLFKLEPFFYKLTGLVIHICNVFLVFLLIQRLCSTSVSVAASFLFAIHPIQVSSVSSVLNRESLLATFFGLFAYAFLTYKRDVDLKCLTAACLFIFVSALTSLSGLVFSILAVFLPKVCMSFKAKATIFFSGVLGVSLSGLSQLTEKASELSLLLSPKKALYSFTLLGKYLAQIIFPFRSSSDYSFNQLPGLNTTSMYFYFLLSFTFLLFGLLLLKKKNHLWFFVFWFFLFFIPGLSEYSEHLSYISSIGFLAILTSCLYQVIEFRFASSLSFVIVIIFSSLSLSRVACWRNDWSLLSCEINNNTQSQKAHAKYSKELFARGRVDLAELYAHRSLGIDPQSITGKIALQEVLVKKEKYSDALNVLASILESQPQNYRAHANAGWSYFGLNDKANAQIHFRKALEYKNGYQSAVIGMYALAVGSVDLEQANFWQKKMTPRSLQDPKYLYWEKFI